MNTYRNDKFGFTISAPEEWSLPTSASSYSPFSGAVTAKCKYYEAFDIKIDRSDKKPSIEQIESDFKKYGNDNNYSPFETGRIIVENDEHVWARYYVGSGEWRKKYIINLAGIEHTITAKCFYQNMLLVREKVWDSVVRSLRTKTPSAKSISKTVQQDNCDLNNSFLKTVGFQINEIKPDQSQFAAKEMLGGMKIFRNEKHGFEIELPESWIPAPEPPSVLVEALTGPLPPGLNKDCFQYGGRDEALNFEIAPLSPEPLLKDTEIEFQLFTRDRVYRDLHIGRIKILGKEHVCAHYFINDFMGQRWNKKYMIVFGGIEYALTFTCDDPDWFAKREKDWDAIAQTFRLLTAVDETINSTVKTERERQQRREVVHKRIEMRQESGEQYAKAYEATLIGQYEIARNLLEACLQEESKHIQAHKLLAVVLQELGDKAGAIRHLREVVLLNPSDLSSRYTLAQMAAESNSVGVIKKAVSGIKSNRQHPSHQRPSRSPKSFDGVLGESDADYTLAFSIRSYLLIETLAFIYIYFGVGFRSLFSFTSESHQPLSNSEFYFLNFVSFLGIGAFVCVMFLIGVAYSDQLTDHNMLFFDRIRRTMIVGDKRQQTYGEMIFSDYTRFANGNLDAFGLQIRSLIHAFIKILTLPFSVGLLHPIIGVMLGVLLFLPRIITSHSPAGSWYAGWTFLLFFFCYRSLLFISGKRKGIGKTNDLIRDRNIILPPSFDTRLQSASTSSVTPDLIGEILRQESVLHVIKSDLIKTGQIGYREIWRLGLITPEQDKFEPHSTELSRQKQINKILKDYNYRSSLSEEIHLQRAAILNNIGAFSIQFTGLTISWGRNGVQGRRRPGKIYRLETKLNHHEFINIRHIQMEKRLAHTEGRSWSFPKFLQEDGFPLKDTYTDGDPLTTERGGTIVIDKEKIFIIYPQYFVQRRLIDDHGNMIYLGHDESFGPATILEVKMRPSISEILFRRVQSNGYIPILRYRSFPYTCDYMLPILDTPMSTSGWADLFIDPRGKAKLFIAKEKNMSEWYEMMNKLRQLFRNELAKKDHHLLGLTQDKIHLNQYLSKKHDILTDYFIIQDLEMG